MNPISATIDAHASAREEERDVMRQELGFVGLGNMGEPFVENLVAAGHTVAICEPRGEVAARWAAKGATVRSSPKELADHVETILLSLPTPDVVEAVCLAGDGIMAGGRVRRVVDLSTTGPRVAGAIAAALHDVGIAYVDAPVSGGVAGARAATVAIMLACDEAERAAVEPILSRLGRIYHVGAVAGLGQVTKVLNNLLSAGSLILAGEVAAMGVKAGLRPSVMIDVFNAGSGRSSATLDKYPKAILPGTFETGFTNALMYKDMGLCLDLAEAMGLDMPTARTVAAEWKAAMALAGAQADFSTIVCRREDLAGVKVRAG